MGRAIILEDCDFEFLNIGQVSVETIPDSGDDIPTYAVSAETNPAVMAICYAQEWAADSGHMTFEEAKAVTSIGEAFKGTSIGTFDEFKYFTGVTAIPNNGFNNCTNLTSITLPSSLTSIGSLAFRYCSNLKAISFPEATVNIDRQAIQGSGVQVITFNSNATIATSGNIQNNAPVTTINLGNKVTDYVMYEGCVYSSDHTTLVMAPVKIASIQFHPSITSIANRAFQMCTLITSIVLPSSVVTIGDYAFADCTNLTSISMPSVTSIGNSGVISCTKLVNISIPSIVTIGDLAFRYTKPTSIDIPATCTKIGNSFQNVTTLTSMTCRATTPPTITSLSLSGWCSGEGKHIYVPSASVDTYKATSYWSSYADYISAISE